MADTLSAPAPIALSPERAAVLSGVGRTMIFKAIREGRLRARKCGRRTVIMYDDLRVFITALPNREVA